MTFIELLWRKSGKGEIEYEIRKHRMAGAYIKEKWSKNM